jgi:hypothetical protein
VQISSGFLIAIIATYCRSAMCSAKTSIHARTIASGSVNRARIGAASFRTFEGMLQSYFHDQNEQFD